MQRLVSLPFRCMFRQQTLSKTTNAADVIASVHAGTSSGRLAPETPVQEEKLFRVLAKAILVSDITS